MVHTDWCTPADCSPVEWDDAAGFLIHRTVFLDADGLIVEIVQGDIICAHGERIAFDDPHPVLQVGTGGLRELTAAQAVQMADALTRAATTLAGGAR